MNFLRAIDSLPSLELLIPDSDSGENLLSLEFLRSPDFGGSTLTGGGLGGPLILNNDCNPHFDENLKKSRSP